MNKMQIGAIRRFGAFGDAVVVILGDAKQHAAGRDPTTVAAFREGPMSEGC